MSTKWSPQVLEKGGTPDFGALLKDEFTILLLRGKNVFGDMIYCYLKITFPDLEKLKIAMATDAEFNISDFGTVVAAGKGDPPEEVKAEMAANYPMLDQPKLIMPSPAAAAPEIPQEKKAWDEY